MKSLANRLPAILTSLAIVALSGMISACRDAGGSGDSGEAVDSAPLIRGIVVESATPGIEPASPTTLITANFFMTTRSEHAATGRATSRWYRARSIGQSLPLNTPIAAISRTAP